VVCTSSIASVILLGERLVVILPVMLDGDVDRILTEIADMSLRVVCVWFVCWVSCWMVLTTEKALV
jgi:hypothetical protein